VHHVDLLVNLNWCIHQLRRIGSFEITTALLGGDPAGFRRALRAAASDEGMRVHTRIITTGLRAWNPDYASPEQIAVDDFDDAVQPRCPDCGLLMRDAPGGWTCPSCRHNITADPLTDPMPDFEGRGIHGG
jgi:hypothetical protein